MLDTAASSDFDRERMATVAGRVDGTVTGLMAVELL
jgi:hypothetical protein